MNFKDIFIVIFIVIGVILMVAGHVLDFVTDRQKIKKQKEALLDELNEIDPQGLDYYEKRLIECVPVYLAIGYLESRIRSLKVSKTVVKSEAVSVKISVDCGEQGYSFDCEVENLNAALGIPNDDNWRKIVIEKLAHDAPEEKIISE